MKFIIKKKKEYNLGDTRIIKKFLWVPKTLNIKEKTSGTEVKRWLERVEITQELQNQQSGYIIRNNTLWNNYEKVWIDKWWNDIDIIVEM